MYEEQFVAEILEQIFSLGLHVPRALRVSQYLERTYDGETMPNPSEFIEDCIDEFDLTIEPNPKWGTISRTAGAAHKWLAVHEAGHAIVGLKVPLLLTGVRFNRGGTKGLAILHDPDWPNSKDEELISHLIAVDVAGIVAENVMQVFHDGCDAPEPYLSTYYGRTDQPSCSSDLIDDADPKAAHLAFLICEREGIDPAALSVVEARTMKKTILVRAEDEAEKILRENPEMLNLLACELLNGPMRGTAVKRLVDAAAK
ncbi:hypothetical protein [Schlesneria paludicola]|uniref:hypothetical protein n=1 Tax=Schlesneria paludicola TaxID=360056 RepID=UPI00029B1D5E|nr:hypothetical protein [Schlesneria paludicola]